jgi:hypothetical protein
VIGVEDLREVAGPRLCPRGTAAFHHRHVAARRHRVARAALIERRPQVEERASMKDIASRQLREQVELGDRLLQHRAVRRRRLGGQAGIRGFSAASDARESQGEGARVDDQGPSAHGGTKVALVRRSIY